MKCGLISGVFDIVHDERGILLNLGKGVSMIITVKCVEKIARRKQIVEAIKLANILQNCFEFRLEDDVKCNDADKCVDWNTFCDMYKEYDNNVIYITDKRLHDNWFSHETAEIALISTYGWEDFFSPPSLKSYILYQIAQIAIVFAGDLEEKMEIKMVHDHSEGCMFDLCVHKEDIKLGMISGNICLKCRSNLVAYGIDEDVINASERILNYVRAEAIGRPIKINVDTAFVVMRFSTNDENSNAFKYGIKQAVENLGMKCTRADDKITSGQILEKVRRNIEKSRFIIAKVDTNNLNVYYELGLAMGLGKDVLLVSESEVVLQLPSDLKNWECLTYTKGNYEELRERIERYYRENYYVI